MSKSAIKTLVKATEIIAAAGVTVNLIGYLEDAKARRDYFGKRLWRNADLLAALIVDSAANAFQTEDNASMADNGFADMAEAVDAYVSSNLDTWNQKEWTESSACTGQELARLEDMVRRHIKLGLESTRIAAFHPVAIAEPRSTIEEGHTEALAMDMDYALWNQRYTDFWAANDTTGRREIIAEAHDAALLMNEEIDTLAGYLADLRCWWKDAETVARHQLIAITEYKRHAYRDGRQRVAQHVIQVMVIAQRKAAAMIGRHEIQRPSSVAN